MQRPIFIDGDRCVGCYACVVACKLEHNLPPYPVHPPLGSPTGPALIRVHQVGPEICDDEVHQYFQPVSCVHCPDAPCIGACPTSAIYKDIETGITLVNQDECTGCESCLEACPYEAPQFYDGKLYLCDLCIHRLAEGRRTACEAACPAKAIHVGTTDEVTAAVGKQAADRAAKG
jgi:anaerobic dimethyl sulfoxide reductase subunit B (iron-sulfur subunit)